MTPRVFERTYSALKKDLTSGAYVPGQRLQARALADALGTSTSPVTDAMHQMIGENILSYSAQDGFTIPRTTVRLLHDLYEMSQLLSTYAIANLDAAGVKQLTITTVDTALPTIVQTEQLLSAIAASTQNGEIVRVVGNINDRLRATRRLETQVFDDLFPEMEGICTAWHERRLLDLQDALKQYHARRLRAVPELVSLSYPAAE